MKSNSNEKQYTTALKRKRFKNHVKYWLGQNRFYFFLRSPEVKRCCK